MGRSLRQEQHVWFQLSDCKIATQEMPFPCLLPQDKMISKWKILRQSQKPIGFMDLSMSKWQAFLKRLQHLQLGNILSSTVAAWWMWTVFHGLLRWPLANEEMEEVGQHCSLVEIEEVTALVESIILLFMTRPAAQVYFLWEAPRNKVKKHITCSKAHTLRLQHIFAHLPGGSDVQKIKAQLLAALPLSPSVPASKLASSQRCNRRQWKPPSLPDSKCSKESIGSPDRCVEKRRNPHRPLAKR